VSTCLFESHGVRGGVKVVRERRREEGARTDEHERIGHIVVAHVDNG
jgi:hypothetical protein